MRDDLRDYVTTRLGDADAVLVVDETGDPRKGVCTVGAQRPYTGTAGRVENAQVAVYLTHACAAGHAMIDRELYLTKSWTSDEPRLTEAGVPDDVGFLTKPALATGMTTRALNVGVPTQWVAGDEVYGADPLLRAELDSRRVGYVLAIGCDRRVPTQAGLRRADEIAAGPGNGSPPGRREGAALLRPGTDRTCSPASATSPSTTTVAMPAPKLLRFQLLHLPARLTRAVSQRRRWLHLRADWPWTAALLHARTTIKALPAPT